MLATCAAVVVIGLLVAMVTLSIGPISAGSPSRSPISVSAIPTPHPPRIDPLERQR